MYIVNIASGCSNGGALFVSLDDLDNISILLAEDNDLEEEITYLFNEANIFIFNFEKNTANQTLKYTQNMYRNTG